MSIVRTIARQVLRRPSLRRHPEGCDVSARRTRVAVRRGVGPAVAGIVAVGSIVLVGSATASAAETDPVIVVAGTVSPAAANEVLRNRLASSGYDAYVFELPALGIGDISESAVALDEFVDRILAQTGASRVDLVGHSQGGVVSRYYVKYLGGANAVDSLVTLGSPNHGTALANLGNVLGVDGFCRSCEQMAIGSTFLSDLNAGDDTIGSVAYTNIYTTNDEIVFPASTARLDDGATNVRLQSFCWLRVIGHLGLIADGAVYDGVRDALRHQSVRPNCFAL
jgi:triacylglycerol lipase